MYVTSQSHLVLVLVMTFLVNLWGFSRNSKETEEPGSYWHPLFVKGRKDLCQEIGRQKIKMQSGQAKEDHRAKLAALPVPELGVSASSSSNSSKSTPLTVQSTGPAALSHISEHSNQSSAAATDVLSLVSRLTRAQSPTLPVVNNTNTNNNTTGHSALSEMLALVGSQNHSNPLLKLNNTTNNNNDALLTALLLQAQLAAAPTKPLTPASFLSAPSAASTAPSTNPLLLGAMMAAAAQAQPAATASNNILAQADAEIVQAMQRKMALERLLHRCAA